MESGGSRMKIFDTEAYSKVKDPTPGIVLAEEDGAKKLGGVLIVLKPKAEGVYHYHERTEAVYVIVSGAPSIINEGVETEVKVGDVIFMPAGEKHVAVNRTDKIASFFEFFTDPPVGSDYVPVV